MLVELRKAGDAEAVEEVRTLLLKLASVMLLAHGRGQAQLPTTPAIWLHMEIDQILRGKDRNLSSLVEVTATSFAAGYIARGPGGDVRGAKTRRVREVAAAFGVSERAAYSWKEERPAFAAAMAKCPSGTNPDDYAVDVLGELAWHYRPRRQPMGK